MQALATFRRDCGLVTGQRSPPSSWWQDPKAKVKRLSKPQYLNDRLDAIKTEFSNFAMIARLRRWRKSKHQQCLEEGLRTSSQLGPDVGPEEIIQKARSPAISRQKNSSPDGASASVMVPEGTHQFGGISSRGGPNQRRTKFNMAEDHKFGGIGFDQEQGLRARGVGAIGFGLGLALSLLCMRGAKQQRTLTGKPVGIVKGRKASRKRRPIATKGQATTMITQKADLLYQLNAWCDSNESPSQATPGNVTKAERITSVETSVPQPNQCSSIAGCTNDLQRQAKADWKAYGSRADGKGKLRASALPYATSIIVRS